MNEAARRCPHRGRRSRRHPGPASAGPPPGRWRGSSRTAGDRGDRDDRLEPLHPGCGDLVGQRAVVGDPGHAHCPVRPGRSDEVAVGVEAAGAAVKPVDHGLGAERFDPVADRRAAVRVEGADALAEHDGIAARHVVVVERAARKVEPRQHPRAGARPCERGLCADAPGPGGAGGSRGPGAALAEERLLGQPVEVHGVVLGRPQVTPVGAVLEYDRHLVAECLGLARAADPDPHPVAAAVSVAVKHGLDEDRLLDRLPEVELRLGLAVLHLEPRRRLAIGRWRRPARPRGPAVRAA
jgi:hypothetical protein